MIVPAAPIGVGAQDVTCQTWALNLGSTAPITPSAASGNESCASSSTPGDAPDRAFLTRASCAMSFQSQNVPLHMTGVTLAFRTARQVENRCAPYGGRIHSILAPSVSSRRAFPAAVRRVTSALVKLVRRWWSMPCNAFHARPP